MIFTPHLYLRIFQNYLNRARPERGRNLPRSDPAASLCVGIRFLLEVHTVNQYWKTLFIYWGSTDHLALILHPDFSVFTCFPVESALLAHRSIIFPNFLRVIS